MRSYESFAYFYDGLTENVDYKSTAAFIDKLLKEKGNGGNLVLDLACGTGSLSFELVKLSYDVVATDKSEEMLSEAMNKSQTFGNPIFLNQSMQNLDLFGTIDAAVCTLDSINHIESIDDVEKAFERVSLFLNDGGLFVFDVNSLYKHREVLGNNSYIYDTDEVYCAWQNQYNENNSSVEILLDFFVPDKNENYQRYQEFFSEFYYSDEQLCAILKRNKLSLLAKFDDYTEKDINDKTQRIVYVCRKEN